MSEFCKYSVIPEPIADVLAAAARHVFGDGALVYRSVFTTGHPDASVWYLRRSGA